MIDQDPENEWVKFNRPGRPAGGDKADAARRPAKMPAATEFSVTTPPADSTRAPSMVRVLSVCGLLAAAIFGVHRFVTVRQADGRTGKVKSLVADFEQGKDPGTLNYQDPVYVKAIEELRAIASDSGADAESRKLLQELEAKQRAFANEMREAQLRMAAQLAAEEARIAAELERQRATTGIDSAAAERLAAQAPEACKEERH